MGWAAIVAISLAACGSKPVARSEATSDGAAGSAVPKLDTHDPKAVDFFARFAMTGMREVEYYHGLSDGVPAANAVIVGEVAKVVETRTFQGEIADDRLSYIGIVLRPVDVLAGELDPKYRAELTVEFTGNPGSIGDLANTLPTGSQGVWFLRHKHSQIPGKPGKTDPLPAEANFFRVVSSQGLFVQGPTSVAAPLAENLPGAKDLAAEGRGYQRVTELVEAVRRIG